MSKVVYASTIDVSATNGPGVNEREFTEALARRFGEAVRFVLPAPAASGVLRALGNRAALYPQPAFFKYGATETLFLRLLRRTVRHFRPDLVIARAAQLPLGLALFARSADCPIVLKTQGDPRMRYSCDQAGIKGWLARRARPANVWAMRTLTSRAAAIDCCTPQLVRRNLEAFGDAYGGKFRVIDNATNLERFRPATKSECRRDVGLPQDAMILGYVGGTPWERGGAQIVDAVARLGEEFPRLCGVIVGGTTGGLEALRSRARERKVADRCTMVPGVPYDDVPTWINALDIGVALDLAERLEYVGSSNQKIRQYLACGKPVIAGAGSTGTNDFIAEHDLGGTVGPGDSTGFDALVRDLLQQTPDLRQAFAMRARRYAEEHLSVDVALEARIAWWRERGVSLNGHGGEHAP